ncbi:MAG: bifunctional glycosyltransferase/CDP-glycerol:glycerophosphate glycerophosphotransferase [Culicoidibacterales bacterium]
MKLLTIGITVYNNARYLRELLYVLENELLLTPQIIGKVDLHIYDDASTEKDVKEILENIKFGNVYYSSKNSGTPAVGRNYIIENSKTKYLLFIDGDDSFIGSLSELVEILDLSQADLLISDVVKIGHDGTYLQSPFIFSDKLFECGQSNEDIYKFSVHQTGIWSIYRHQFLLENEIKYRTDIRYEDNYLMTVIHLMHPSIESLAMKYYGWRMNNSSFSHEQKAVESRVKVYEEILSLITLPENINKPATPYLYYSIWNQTYGNIIRAYPKLTLGEYKEYFSRLKEAENKYNKEMKHIIKKIHNKNIKKIARVMLKNSKFKNCYLYLILQQFSIIWTKRQKIRSKILGFMFLFPMNKNKYFLTSHYGDFCDNTKYLYLKMKNSKKKVRFAVKNPKYLNEYYKTTDFFQYNNRLLFFYHHYTAKYILFMSWYSPLILKRKNQSWEQLWHGLPIKKVYSDIHSYRDTITKSQDNDKKSSIKNWDYVWSINSQNTRIFTEIFQGVKIKEQQYPKIEWLLKNQENIELKDNLKMKYGLKRGQTYVVYAPTYRPYKLYIDVKDILSKLCPNEKLIIHLHPMLRLQFIGDSNDPRIHKIMGEIDIQELILVTEKVITDYSSIGFDYEVINKEVIIYATDLEVYDGIQGLYERDKIEAKNIFK